LSCSLSLVSVFDAFCYRPDLFLFFFNAPATTEIYTLSLHDALPISPWLEPLTNRRYRIRRSRRGSRRIVGSTDIQRSTSSRRPRSEEHTSELQSPYDLVCRLLLEKKKKI